MSADDTRYTIVSKRVKPASSAQSSNSALPVAPRTSNTSLPVAPAKVAQGSKTIPIHGLRDQIAAEAARNTAAVLPRVFGGCDVVVEAAEGDRVAVVLPGALRLIGSRDEAMALAAALLRAAKSER